MIDLTKMTFPNALNFTPKLNLPEPIGLNRFIPVSHVTLPPAMNLSLQNLLHTGNPQDQLHQDINFGLNNQVLREVLNKRKGQIDCRSQEYQDILNFQKPRF